MGVMLILYFVISFQCLIASSLNCEDEITCRECIRNENNCVWCAMENFKEFSRCRPEKIYGNATDWCPNFVLNPKSSMDPTGFVDRKFSSEGDVIQIKPQKYKINLRPGESVNFNFSFKAAEDYPVDLYFLLDASDSMSEIKQETAEQSEKIYYSMKNETNNVQLGMGTFVDKNACPFTNNPKTNKTYSFINRLPLTPIFENFTRIMNETALGSNYDDQEGGLDALVQVMVCKNVIKWRDNSRRIIIFMTDAPYHTAGDGKWAGIIKPNDGLCNTNENGVYTKELEMDYPSVSLINKIATEQEISIVFLAWKKDDSTVNSKLKDVYGKLQKSVRGSKHVQNSNENIVTILKDIYREITQTIKLKTVMKREYRDYIQIDFKPNCTDETTLSDECYVKNNEEKKFEANIKLLKYFDKDDGDIPVMISIEGIKEKLQLDINVIDRCECEQDGEHNSSLCSNNGIRQCGICECNSDRYGKNCVCVKNSNINVNDNSTCSAPGSNDLCSGRGTCVCGACQCYKGQGYGGQYCHINEVNCTRGSSSAPCNGNGLCTNGNCVCSAGWAGEACDCTAAPCVKINGEECNKRGKCVCGSCECELISDWDARNNQSIHCEVSPCSDCHSLQCRLLEKCVYCHLFGGSCACDDRVIIQITNNLNSYKNLNDDEWDLCENIKAGVGCYTHFKYRYLDDSYGIELVLQTETNCAESYYMYGGGFFAALVLIGLATVITWKLLVDARDRKEYERFTKRNALAIVDLVQNDLYEPPTTTINNPVFGRKMSAI